MNNFLYHALAAVGAIRSYPAPQPVTWETVFGSRGGSLSGVSVTEHSSLRHSPVWCGVTTLAADVARVPLSLYKVLPTGGKIPFRAHKTYRVLHDDANPEMTSYKFRETMQLLCVLFGNAYAEIVLTNAGDLAGLYPILPSRVTPFREERGGRLLYRITNPNGGQTILRPEQIIHLSSVSFDGIIGESMVNHAAESIGLGVAAEKFGAAFFGNGATFGGVASFDQKLDPAQRLDIQTAIEAVHQGIERAHKILVLGMGAKFTERGTKPGEAQLTELRDFQVREVARWLKMPPHKLQDYKDAHFTNVEHSEISYWVGCVGSWFKMWEQELARKLIKPLEYGQQAIGFNMNAQMRGDSQARGEFYSKMFSIGALSVNNILELEDMNPIGASGDLHLVPLNMVPLERYNEMIDAQIEAKKPKEIEAPKPKPEEGEAERALAQAIEERDAALRSVTEHEARIHEAQNEVTTKARELDEARALAAEQERAGAEHATRADVAGTERDLAVLEAQATKRELVAKQEALDVAQRALEAAQAEAVAAAAEAADRAARLAASDAALTEVRSALTSTEQTVAARRAAELDRLTSVVAAHRTLIVHAVQRLLRPEVDRARRRQGTPEQLRKWVDAFYVTHREVCADEFYPAVLTHLAWKQSADEPRAVARAMAEAHCAQSEKELRAVLDGTDDGHDLHATLERVLGRWEQERPQIAADGLLHDELAYIRSFQ